MPALVKGGRIWTASLWGHLCTKLWVEGHEGLYVSLRGSIYGVFEWRWGLGGVGNRCTRGWCCSLKGP